MNGSLYLSPRDPRAVPDPARVSQCLSELRIQGPLLVQSPDKQVKSAGNNFARHVIYAGCSPHLRFEPEGPHDRDFCHIALIGPYPEPQVVTGENTAPPRCPNCRARVREWREQMHTGQLRCPACDRAFPAWELDWRQQAANGRYFIELRNVFPGEATPSDQLLAQLQSATEMEWTYAWAGMSPEP